MISEIMIVNTSKGSSVNDLVAEIHGAAPIDILYCPDVLLASKPDKKHLYFEVF